MAELINEIGNRYGKLTVIKRDKNKSYKSGTIAVWTCLCDCGVFTNVSGNALRSQHTTSCGCIYLRDPKLVTLRVLFCRYAKNASKRSYCWDIPFDIFSVLVTKPCFYCGAYPNQTTKTSAYYRKPTHYKYQHQIIEHNGIDRINNTQGYTIENVVTCCKQCNIAKASLSLSEFKSWIQSLYHCWGKI